MEYAKALIANKKIEEINLRDSELKRLTQLISAIGEIDGCEIVLRKSGNKYWQLQMSEKFTEKFLNCLVSLYEKENEDILKEIEAL